MPKESSNERIRKMIFASIYPSLLQKIEKKGRTEAELLSVIEWLTGYNPDTVRRHIKDKSTLPEFFNQAQMNPLAKNIKGSICGVKIIEIEDPLMKKVRWLDKLVDELYKGKTLERILKL